MRPKVKGRKILLTDDLYQSGITLNYIAMLILEQGAKKVYVLAEGILNFRIKRDLKDVFDESRVLILSEFLPGLPWSVHNKGVRSTLGS